MIPDIKELNFPKIDGNQYATLTQATVNVADMGEKNITTQVKIDGDIVPDFSHDWEVEFQGEKYIMPLRIPQGAKENTSLNSTIDLTFQHWAIYQLKRWPFVTIQQIAAGTYLADEEVASVSLNLKDFCILFGQVLEYYYGNAITIDLNPAWEYDNAATVITISHTKIWNVLAGDNGLYKLFGVRWEIKPATDNSNTVKGGERYVIRVGYPTTEVDHIFKYGFEGGLLKVERQVQSEEIRNMLKGRGGDKNIPFRYFKNTDPNNPDFQPDPDWVEELANIYFPNLMPATFRSYVQGWKAAHINKTDADGKKIYAGYTPVGEDNAYAPWAYRKGYTDTKFAPVEFVADEITINPYTGDKQVQILPGYSPFVKKGSSIDKYGPLPDTLDNNDDIYPTLQGTGLDIAVDVEQIESDDVAGSTESDAQLNKIPGSSVSSTAVNVAPSSYATIKLPRVNFSVQPGKHGNLIVNVEVLSAVHNGKQIEILNNAEKQGSETINVYNAITGEKRSASGIPEGSYYFEVEVSVHNMTTDKTLNISAGTTTVKLQDATLTDNKWRNTFDIWVKNIWNSIKLSTETNEQYAERVWKPVLGDRESNAAKVVFTSGALAVSEDYEFTIVDFPAPDTSKTWEEKNEQGGVIATHTSHWRITLAKSDAELEATGLYVPSTQKQGKAGDRFVFIGTEMTHLPYVVDAEVRQADWLNDNLGEVKEIKPTAVVTTDRVRLNNEGKPNALINQLRVGNSLRLFDKRFFNEEGKAYETLYLQSITYTYREPSKDDAALNPDVQIVLGDEYTTSANPVSMMQSEINALQRQVGSISNIEQIVRAVGDRLYLRKDGISDRSLSPTQFFSLLTSGDFRAGLVGGAGWGFFKDENGNWVLEADRVNVRQEMQVNTLVINQAEGRGGMEVDTAAYMNVTRVDDTADGYVCYFDQKGGSVANLFHVDDVAFCNQWTSENSDLKFYKRRVTAVGIDNITLSKTDVNGTGVPAEGDNIIHFGSYTDATRQYVKVRDVVGGGYERYIEALNSVNAEGVEYYFIGKQADESRWFVGNKDLVPYSGDGDGSYIEYINRKFNLNNVSLSVGTTIGDKTLAEYIQLVSPPVEQEDIEGFVNNIVDPKIAELQNQIDGVIETWFYNGVPTLTNYPASEWATDALKIAHLGDLYYDNDTGTAYRFSQDEQGTYFWNTITDDAITKALAAAQKAQDTADRKRRVFTAQPTAQQEYDQGDLWVNATYGTQYSNDLLRCVTHKDAGAAFNIAHWTLASKYTDDSALNNFITGYQSTINDIKTQIDGKAETWYQSTNPAAAWTTAADKAAHKGDLWYCTADITGTNYKKGTTWYWNGTAWEKQDIPQSVFDTIDGKANIFVSKPTSYHKNDLWFLETDYTLSGVAYKQGTLVVAKQGSNTWDASHWVKKDCYTDDTLAQTAIDRIAGYEYLKNALLPENPTQITGGLIMSTLISLGYTDSAGRHTMAGMNGSWVNSHGGRTIASWWGGEMTDRFGANGTLLNPVPDNAATALVRMDGSAYWASGNIQFRANGTAQFGLDDSAITIGADGHLTIGNGISINIGGNAQVLGESIASVTELANKLSHLFTPYLGNSAKSWASIKTLSDYDSIKVNKSIWTDGFVSARGLNPNGGGSGTGGKSYLSDLLDVDLGTLSSGQVLTWNGTKWVNSALTLPDMAGYALESWVEANYVTLNTNQTITGKKSFTDAPIFNFYTTSHDHAAFLINKLGTNYFGMGGNDVSNVIQMAMCNHLGEWILSDTSLILKVIGTVQANSFVKVGGTSAQFLKADGTVDSNSYLLESTYTAADVLNKIKTVDGGGSGLDADLLDGVHGSSYLYASQYCGEQKTGVLVKTDVPEQNDAMLTVHITGNSYSGLIPIDTYIQFYSYNNSQILYRAAINNGADFGAINVFMYKGYVCLWFPQPRKFMSFNIFVSYTNLYGLRYNRVISTTYTTMPTEGVTRLVTITPKQSAFTTDNVASATKLQTARTIWGQSFDGTGNVSGNLSGVGSIVMNGGIEGVHYIELKSATPFIDFHFNNDSGDYTSRIIEGASGRLHINNAIFANYSGNVGIGTSTPTAKLDVAGLVKASSGIQIGSTADIGWYFRNSRVCAGAGTARGVNVGSLLVSGDWPDDTKVPTHGIYATGEIISSNINAFRAISGDYGAIIRNDGEHLYFLLTNSKDQYGDFNGLRPLYINLATGLVKMQQGLQIGECTISWDAANNMLKFDKGLYSEGGVSARGINTNAGGSGTSSGDYMKKDASNAGPYAMGNLIVNTGLSQVSMPADDELFICTDGQSGNTIAQKFPMTSLWKYIKTKADSNYATLDNVGLANLMWPVNEVTESMPSDDDMFAVADVGSDYDFCNKYHMSSLWQYIKSKMGLAFTVDGDNVNIGCQPGQLTLNGVTINAGSAVTCNSLTAQGVTAYGVTIGGPSADCVKIKYQGKTYTLQLAKLIQAGYLA